MESKHRQTAGKQAKRKTQTIYQQKVIVKAVVKKYANITNQDHKKMI